jgi:hypothetical protein
MLKELFRAKSDVEIPWDSFTRTFRPVLKRASRGFRQRYGRTLDVGSPVRVAAERADLIRVPIEVRGGEREYAVATLLISGGLKVHYDEHLLEQIAKAALAAAEAHPTEPPPNPGALVLAYP